MSPVTLTAAAAPFPAHVLRLVGIYAGCVHDPTVYCLLGAGACVNGLAAGAEAADVFITDWLTRHPSATVVPICEQTVAFPQ
jgi:hypothetical protein